MRSKTSLNQRLQSFSWHWLFSRNFCSWTDPARDWARTPIGLLTLAWIAAVLLALAVGPGAVWPVGAITTVIVIGTLWPFLSIRGVSGEFAYSQRKISENQPVDINLSITNRWPWPVWALQCQGGSSSGITGACGCTPGSSQIRFSWPFLPPKRGVYPHTKVWLATAFPFAIGTAARQLTSKNTLIVWPRTVRLRNLLDVAQTRPSDEHFTDTRVGETGDVLGTRAFRAGDSLRRIHWPQTARKGTLVVCERQAPTNPSVRIVFDQDEAVHHPLAGTSSLEWSVRIAASIAIAYHNEQASVECCFAHKTLVMRHGAIGLEEFMNDLAVFDVGSKNKKSNHDHPEHEHDGECHRIHHRNCGVFQVTITTYRGLGRRIEHRHVHGDQLWVVLAASTDKVDCPPQGIGEGRLLWVQDAVDPLVAFQRGWEKICHVG